MLSLSQYELDCEKWKLVPGTTNLYVSDMGRVKKVLKTKERFMKPYFRKRKPPYFIKVNGKEIKLAVVVWKTFVGDYDSSRFCVMHKVVTTDDRLINLKILSKQELGKRTGGMTKKVRGIYKCDRKKRIIYDFYKTSREAAKKNWCSYQTILDSCNKKYKSNCTGYDFVWATAIDGADFGKGKKEWTWECDE